MEEEESSTAAHSGISQAMEQQKEAARTLHVVIVEVCKCICYLSSALLVANSLDSMRGH